MISGRAHHTHRPSSCQSNYTTSTAVTRRVTACHACSLAYRVYPLSDTLGALARESCFQRVGLSGFSQEEAEHFIALATGIAPPHNLVECLCRHTEGSPLLLSEWVQLLAQDGDLTPERWADRDNIPSRIPEAYGWSLGDISIASRTRAINC
jgi:hypothetical protein